LKRIHALALVLCAAAACRSRPAAEAPSQVQLAQAMRPERFAAAVRKLGGAHFHGTAKLAVGPTGGAPTGVTTTTDVWVDRTGNYRLHEENDQDGGRDVVLHGRELAVALRYGKMVRRIAEEPEPTQLLEQALGAPWSLFELAGSRAHVTPKGGEDHGGAKATAFDLTLGAGESTAKGPGASFYGLRAWRETAAIESLTGHVVADDATGALLQVVLTARFTGRGPSGPIAGTFEVRSALTEVGSTAAIARPDAEELALRQRTVPEQKELLRGLAQTRPPSAPANPRRPAVDKSHGPGPGK
jgi:hypothetical protein